LSVLAAHPIYLAFMTVQEFDNRGKFDKPCHCGNVGMLREHNANNGGELVVCPNCHSRRPWGSLLYLKHTKKTNRKDDRERAGCSVVEVWAWSKNRCSMCTLPMHALVDLRIGISRHHITERYDSDETDCRIIPICNACKALVDGRQREAWRWYHRLQEFKRKPISERGSDLSEPGLSPDSMRAEGEAAIGAAEEFRGHLEDEPVLRRRESDGKLRK
jgi:hypothetical protein